MKKIMPVLALLFLLANCGKLEFVYKISNNIKLLKGFTNIEVSGDDSDQIHSVLKELIQDNKNIDTKYKLIVNSTKEEVAAVIEKDATASKFNIKYKINYTIYYLEGNCVAFDTEITTYSMYSSKAAGYSFATDLIQKETSIRNLEKNSSEFISKLSNVEKIDSCSGL
jgi:hypothetical protein